MADKNTAGAGHPLPEMKILEQILNKMFPHGHELFTSLCLQEIELHSSKNFDYAEGGDALGNFYRVAKIFEQYPDLKLSDPIVVALAYAMKQLDQVLWSLSRGFEGDIEGINKRLSDGSVYFKLAMILNTEKSKKQE